MSDTSVTKIDAVLVEGEMGQKHLAAGITLSMGLWEDAPPREPMPETRRAYETVSYVVKEMAELHLEGQVVRLEPGNSWVVPKGTSHTYKVLESFTAVEATSPPADVHGRDDRPPSCRTARRGQRQTPRRLRFGRKRTSVEV